MKKILLVISMVFIGAAANAQWFIGGGIGYNSYTEKPDNGTKYEKSSFEFTPTVGYSISDKFDLGVMFAYETTKEKPTDNAKETKKTGWLLGGFGRLTIAEFGKFKIVGCGELGGGKKTQEYDYGNLNKKYEATGFVIGITPELHYDLSEHITLWANLCFAELSLDITKWKDAYKETELKLGFDTNKVSTLGALEIGAIYRF